MCGIAGIWIFRENDKAAGESAVGRMLERMGHRGPDARGLFSGAGATLGHNRLSIVDLSSAANQPFFDKSGRYVTVFNGEIYNFRQLKDSIKDHDFLTSGDTEVLIEGFARWGVDVVKRCAGMFAFAVLDLKEERLFLFRDRMGVKPLYYFFDGTVLVFASEIRAILASGLINPQLSLEAVSDFFKYQSVTSLRGIVRGIHEVKAGHYLEFHNAEVSEKKFWNLTDKREIGETSPEAVRRRVSSLFAESVQKRLISDVPIGAFLSGGIDSSAVVAEMSKCMSTRPITFNIGFSESDFDESSFAQIIADKYDTIHHRIILKPEALLDELFPALDAMDTPTGDGINTYVVSKAVKNEGLTVALSGVGGDELFAGYPSFRKFSQLKKLNGFWQQSSALRKVASGLVEKGSKWRDLLGLRSTNISEIYPVLRQVGSYSKLASILKTGSYHDPIQDILEMHQTEMEKFDPLAQFTIAEYFGYTSQTLLKDTDQMSMAVSLEVREPFFDHDLIEYVLAVPDHLKYPHSPKKLLVDSLGDLLPPEVVNRKKQGFTFPWRIWMRSELRQFCENYIENVCERDFVDPVGLRKKWSQFLAGDASVMWQEVWLFVILEYWLEKNGVN